MKYIEVEMIPKTVYIAGPITNNENYLQDFQNAENKLKEMGFTKIINPTCLSKLNLDYEQFMKITLAMVETSDIVYLLRNWKKSGGAKREAELAFELKKDVMYEIDEEYKDFQ